jgi:glycosyltransferase involved in cell wall biosynthesis
MLKLVYIVSNINKALAFEWVAEHLDCSKFHISFILIHDKEDTDLKHFLDRKKIPNYFISYTSKKSLPSAFIKCTRLLWSIKPSIVHTHLFEANFIGLMSAKFSGIQKRIYTRHYATLNHTYYPQMVKWDRLINFLATDIISISEATKHSLIDLENVREDKIHDIPHGFELELFSSRNQERVEGLNKKYNIEVKSPVIGVISRYTVWKGIEYTICAFKQLLIDYPNAILMLANAKGDYISEINKELSSISRQNYIEIPFENDIASLYHLFDLYIHVPIDKNIEAFGQTYIESMAAGIPSIFTLSGIGSDVCKHEENCLVVDYKNSDEILDAMLRLLNDNLLKQSIIENAKKISQLFGLKLFINKLENLYKT